MFVDAVCAETGLQMPNIARLRRQRLQPPGLDITAEPPAVPHVSRNHSDGFPMSRRSPLQLEETQQCQYDSFIYSEACGAAYGSDRDVPSQAAAARPAGGFLFKSGDIVKVSHRLIRGGRGGGGESPLCI